MEIQLSKRLKLLRQKNNKTQDELALFLGISSQAVSKWERNEGFPDITLLPKIAGYFHISVDELLGVDEIAKQDRIDEITKEYNRIRRHEPLDPNYKLDEGIELIRNALLELPAVFFFEQCAKYAEGNGRLSRCAGFGNDVDAYVFVLADG